MTQDQTPLNGSSPIGPLSNDAVVYNAGSNSTSGNDEKPPIVQNSEGARQESEAVGEALDEDIVEVSTTELNSTEDTAASESEADETAIVDLEECVDASIVDGKPTVMEVVESLLKSPVELFHRRDAMVPLLIVFAACHLIYGLIIGSFSGDWQWVAAPTKVVLGTVISGLLCLPSLYIFACLSGAKIGVSDACRLLCGALALTSLLLLGFAPVAFIFSFSVQSLTFMGAIHLAIWVTAIGFGIRYVTLGVNAKSGNSGGIMAAWSFVLILTVLQMSTTLRPILGSADTTLTAEKRFFLSHWMQTMPDEVEEHREEQLRKNVVAER